MLLERLCYLYGVPESGGSWLTVQLVGCDRYFKAHTAELDWVAAEKQPPATGPAWAVTRRYPFDTVCLPLSCSGNPGVNGESYRGANGTPESEAEQQEAVAITRWQWR